MGTARDLVVGSGSALLHFGQLLIPTEDTALRRICLKPEREGSQRPEIRNEGGGELDVPRVQLQRLEVLAQLRHAGWMV